MRYPARLLIGSIALLAAVIGVAAPPTTGGAQGNTSPAAIQNSSLDGAAATQKAEQEPGTTEAVRSKPKRLVVRGRLDDGKYLGFRQHAEDIRSGDPVQAETDRLRRPPQAPAK